MCDAVPDAGKRAEIDAKLMMLHRKDEEMTQRIADFAELVRETGEKLDEAIEHRRKEDEA